MSLIFSSAPGSEQEGSYRFRVDDIEVAYRIPKELNAAYTRMNRTFVSKDDPVIYRTAFMRRTLLGERSIGNFTIGIIAIPDAARENPSLVKLGEYFSTAIASVVSGQETAVTSVYTSLSGDWLKIELRPTGNSAQVSGVLFYQPISDRHVLFVGLNTQQPDWWPPKLLRKLEPAVKNVLKSIVLVSLKPTG
jgi:hypothetical protein